MAEQYVPVGPPSDEDRDRIARCISQMVPIILHHYPALMECSTHHDRFHLCDCRAKAIFQTLEVCRLLGPAMSAALGAEQRFYASKFDLLKPSDLIGKKSCE